MLLNSIMTWVKSDKNEQAFASASAERGWRDDYGYYHYHPPSDKPVVWLCGPVGCGKSAIAQIVAKQAEDEGRLAASFFFFRGMGDRSSIARLAATLASQMAEAFPDTIPFIVDALKKSLSLQGASIETQFERLLYNPALAALGGHSKRPILILIDGFDECEDRDEVEDFIDHMLSMFERHPDLPLRFFISSRIEEHIREHIEVDQVHVVNLRDHHSDKDIRTLVRHTFNVAASRNRVIRSYGKWPSEGEIDALIRHARGSFIFIRTLLNFILGVESRRDDRRTPMDRFKLALEMDPGLDELYTEILQDALPIPHSINVFLTLATLREPLSISDIAKLLDIRAFDVANVLVPLQSIVHVPGDDETRVTLFHTSLREFIRNPDRSQSIFSETSRSEHRCLLAQTCLQLRMRIQEGGQSTFPYAMHYWSDHWYDAYSSLTDLGSLMDLVVAAAGNVPTPIPLRLAMVLFDAQMRLHHPSSDSMCDWLSDALGRPAAAVIAVKHTYRLAYQSGQHGECDPSLHKCTVMHLMRCVMSNSLQRSWFVYIAEKFSWHVLRIVNADDGYGDLALATFLQSLYPQERAHQAPFKSTFLRELHMSLGDECLHSVVDIVHKKVRYNNQPSRLYSHAIISLQFPGIIAYNNAEEAGKIRGHYIIYVSSFRKINDTLRHARLIACRELA